MPVKGLVHGGAKIVVDFVAVGANSGPTVTRVSWVPQPGGSVPAPDHGTIAPGTGHITREVVPASGDARAVHIDFLLFDAVEQLDITVTENGNLLHQGSVSADGSWTYVVV